MMSFFFLDFGQTLSAPMTHSLQEKQTNRTITQSLLDDLTDEEEDSNVY